MRKQFWKAVAATVAGSALLIAMPMSAMAQAVDWTTTGVATILTGHDANDVNGTGLEDDGNDAIGTAGNPFATGDNVVIDAAAHTLTVSGDGSVVAGIGEVHGDGAIVFDLATPATAFAVGEIGLGGAVSVTSGAVTVGTTYSTDAATIIGEDGTLVINGVTATFGTTTANDGTLKIVEAATTFTGAYSGTGTLELGEDATATFVAVSTIATLKGAGAVLASENLTVTRGAGTNSITVIAAKTLTLSGGTFDSLGGAGTVAINGDVVLSGAVTAATLNVSGGTSKLGSLGADTTIAISSGVAGFIADQDDIIAAATGTTTIAITGDGKLGLYEPTAETLTFSFANLFALGLIDKELGVDPIADVLEAVDALEAQIVGLDGTWTWELDDEENPENATGIVGTFAAAPPEGLTGDFYAEAAAQALTMHHRYTALNAVRDRLISGSGNSRASRGFFGQSPCDPCGVGPCDEVCNPCDPVCGGLFNGGGNRSAWVNYVGRSDAFRSNVRNNNYTLSSEGVQMGADLYRTKNSQLGVLFGYESVIMRNLTDRLNMDDVYFGFYGVRVFRGGADARVIFAYGHQEYDALADGEKMASFKGYTTETTLELGKRYGGALSFRPAIALDIFNNNLKGNQAVNLGKTDLTQTFIRLGSDLRYQTKRMGINSGLYYSYDMRGQDLNARNWAGDITATASKPGRELWTFNLGTDFQVSKRTSVFGGYQGEYVADRANSQIHSAGYVGIGTKW